MLNKREYEGLSRFRSDLARFLRFSERACRASGITATQYLLLLHIRGFPGRDWATVGELAVRLQASPHGTCALIERCVALDLVSKHRSEEDGRQVQVRLTPRSRELLERIAILHRNELQSLSDVFRIADVN